MRYFTLHFSAGTRCLCFTYSFNKNGLLGKKNTEGKLRSELFIFLPIERRCVRILICMITSYQALFDHTGRIFCADQKERKLWGRDCVGP
jgi:hypothetical protein